MNKRRHLPSNCVPDFSQISITLAQESPFNIPLIDFLSIAIFATVDILTGAAVCFPCSPEEVETSLVPWLEINEGLGLWGLSYLGL